MPNEMGTQARRKDILRMIIIFVTFCLNKKKKKEDKPFIVPGKVCLGQY